LPGRLAAGEPKIGGGHGKAAGEVACSSPPVMRALPGWPLRCATHHAAMCLCERRGEGT
jgi:hypothetical protein